MFETNVIRRFASFFIAAFLVFSSANIAQEKTTNENENDPGRVEQQDQGQINQQDQTQDAQENQQFQTSANELTESLAATVTLRDDQKSDISEAIYEYHEAVIEQGTETENDAVDTDTQMEDQTDVAEEKGDMDQWLNDEIESILDDSQKAQWQVAKADFWNQLRDKVATLKTETNKEGMY